MPLRANHDDLSDLATGNPELFDDSLGVATGVRILRKLGGGGMASVFLGERERGTPSSVFSPLTPERMALKFMQASTARELTKLGVDAYKLFSRESVALARLSDRQPSCPYVVGFYGCGVANVETRSGVRKLPWLALEFVDGGPAGSTLTERIERTSRGIDPLRALRLVKGMVQGLAAIHDEKMIHRDLKPDNVLTAGPIDDEIPKLTDYGIARVEGLETGVAGATLAYAGFEQLIPSGGARNPLIGVWSDVHALACVVWYIIAGEQWYVDSSWFTGARRSLRTAARLHPGFVVDERALDALDALDAVLARGASPRLPAIALETTAASVFQSVVSARYPAMNAGVERHADLPSFAGELLPILERITTLWADRAARDNVPVTAYRPTLTLTETTGAVGPYAVEERAAAPVHPPTDPPREVSLEPGNVAFQPDGKMLARDRERLLFFVDQQPYAVVLPAIGDERPTLTDCRAIAHLGELGYAVVKPRSILFVRSGRWTAMPAPFATDGREVGEIQAILGSRGQLVVVTAETDDSEGGPELWRTNDGETWSPQVSVPLGGDVHAIADGPYGTLLVGSKKGKRARAAFVAPDGATTVFASGVGNGPPLRLALCSAERESWGVSNETILRFDRGSAEVELTTLEHPPVHIAADIVGLPWLVTEHSVLRREASGTAQRWRTVYAREVARPKLVAIGFTPDGARVVDATGASVRLTPNDIDRWRTRTA